jgi:hypothetical protein
MNFNEGDRVFLRPDLKEGVRYGGWVYIFPDSLKHTDRLVTITKVNGDCYDVSHPLISDEEMCWITDEMIAGYGFEYGEKCLMWDGQETCATEQIFTAYVYGGEFPYRTMHTYGYKYAKSLHKQPKTVTITLTEAQLEEVKKYIKID